MKLKLKTVNDWKVKGVIITKEAIIQLQAFSKEIKDENIRKGYDSVVSILQTAYEDIE